VGPRAVTSSAEHLPPPGVGLQHKRREERNELMRKYSAMLAAAALVASSGIASAQSQTPRSNDNSGAATSGQRTTPSDTGRGTGMTGAPSSSNPQAGGGAGGLTTSPHQVPENGGAPNTVVPNTKR
jgi:hypothetical protein